MIGSWSALCAFDESLEYPPELVGEEARLLGRLHRLAPEFALETGLVFTAAAEESFYLTNNLPEQLRGLFAGVNPRRLDEDALEAACERARAKISGSFVLEDFVAQTRTALGNLGLPGRLHVRRPGQSSSEAGEGPRGALLALKRLWAADWGFEAVLERLDTAGSVGLEARPALLFAGPGGPESDRLSIEVSRVLGHKLRARVNEGRLCGLLPAD